jgi:hypothetical protein
LLPSARQSTERTMHKLSAMGHHKEVIIFFAE